MDEVTLAAYTRALAGAVESILPDGPSRKGRALFFLLFTDESRIAQYCSNAIREDVIKMLRETADRLEKKGDSRR